MADQVRVLRVIEYLGEREAVEKQIAASLHGSRICGRGLLKITATTLTEFPEAVFPEVIFMGGGSND